MKATNLNSDYCQHCATLLTLHQRNELSGEMILCLECARRFHESGDYQIFSNLKAPEIPIVPCFEKPYRECGDRNEKKKTKCAPAKIKKAIKKPLKRKPKETPKKKKYSLKKR